MILGIALQLGQAGATVYITGREPTRSDTTYEASLPALDQTAKGINCCILKSKIL